MQIPELCDETLYCSLALPTLKQHALVKIAETLLLSRHHPAQELTMMVFHWQTVFYTVQEHIQWHQRWGNYRQRISYDLDQLPYQNTYKTDYRATTMHLLLNLLNFPHPRIFNHAITYKFTARGDLDLRWMFEGYMTRTLRVPDLQQEKKYELLSDACHLYQDQCIQFILCDLLNSERSALVPLLSNARRSLEYHIANSRERWVISFELEYVARVGSWERFVTQLNSKHLEDITFSFEQNVMKVTTLGKSCHYSGILCLWPKLTTNGKYDHASQCCEEALHNSDTLLLIRAIRFLNSTSEMKLSDWYVSIIVTFLKHPYDSHFLPDLQFDPATLPDWERYLILNHILEVYLEGDFCSVRRDALIRLWKYISSRDKAYGDRLLLSIKGDLDYVTQRKWFLSEPRNDGIEVTEELYQLFPFVLPVSNTKDVLLMTSAMLFFGFVSILIVFFYQSK